MKKTLKKILGLKTDFNSTKYWEKRYKKGGNSGDGSYGRLAAFKADFINEFIKSNNIKSVIEFGSGDGNQVSLINYPKYLGLDVSMSAIAHCKEKFKKDDTKSFIHYDPLTFMAEEINKAELTLSLDVIYHIIEEHLYKKYLNDLFIASCKYVIIYATNFDKADTIHVLHREFLKYVQNNIPSFEFVNEISNPFPGIGEQESLANFFIFRKKEL